MLHHTDDPSQLLEEAKRVAYRFIIVRDHVLQGCISRQVLPFMDYVGNAHHGVRLPHNYLWEAQWQSMFSGLDLSVQEVRANPGLYPFPASRVFERGLHRVSKLRSPAHDSGG